MPISSVDSIIFYYQFLLVRKNIFFFTFSSFTFSAELNIALCVVLSKWAFGKLITIAGEGC